MEAEIKCPECESEDVTATALPGGAIEWRMTCNRCENLWISGIYTLTPAVKTRAQKHLDHARTSPTGTIIVESEWMSIFCKALGAR